MSDASLVAKAIGRDWHFRLTVGQWMKLQHVFKGGPQKISERLGSVEWQIEDVREIIERGLEGGGLDAAEARTTATEIMDGQSGRESYELATDILTAAWAGMEELRGKRQARQDAEAILSKLRTGNGASAISLAPASSPESSRPNASGSASPSSSA